MLSQFRIRYRAFLGLFIAVSVSLMGALDASAEPASNKTGRFPDGRAYRTDESGFRLTDHVAELEVTVNDLRRQVAALENELAAKKGESSTAAPGEREIKVTPKLPAAARDRDASETETTNFLAACKTQNAVLNNEIAKLRLEVTALNSRSAANEAGGTCLSQTQPLREQIAQLQQALMTGPSKELVEGQSEENKELSDTVSSLRAKLAASSTELEQTKTTLAKAEEELAARRRREGQLVGEAAERVSDNTSSDTKEYPVFSKEFQARASIDRPVMAKEDEEASESEEEQALSESELKQARQSFSTTLASIQGLIGERKALYDSVKSRRRDVTVSISRLATANGDSLDNLRARVKKVSAPSEVSALRSGLGQIERVLTQDIALLKRLSSRS